MAILEVVTWELISDYQSEKVDVSQIKLLTGKETEIDIIVSNQKH